MHANVKEDLPSLHRSIGFQVSVYSVITQYQGKSIGSRGSSNIFINLVDTGCI
jgi:hypothetical protein